MTHKHHSSKKPKIKIITVSDSRTKEQDKSGDLLEKELSPEAKEVKRTLIPDEKKQILQQIDLDKDILIYCGGTGISKRDVTIETIKPLLEKELPGFGEYFRQKSRKEIGTRTILTRTTAGKIQKTIIFAIPGSKNAAKNAAEIIKNQTNHLMYHKEE